MQPLWLVIAVALALGPPPVDVTIQGFGYRPKVLEVPAGTRVVWTNTDEIEHTVTAALDSGARPGFNGILPGQGTTFSLTFERPGTFVYECARHTFMRGEIRVLPTGEN